MPPVTARALFTVSVAAKVSVTELVTVRDLMRKAASTVGAKVVPPPILTASVVAGIAPDVQFSGSLQLILWAPVHVLAAAHTLVIKPNATATRLISIRFFNAVNNLSNRFIQKLPL